MPKDPDPADEFATNQELIVTAHQNLEQGVWDYISGGGESETTLRRNRQSLDSIAFRPRVLRDVSEVDTSGTFLGHRLRLPVMLAPIGSMQTMSANGAVDAARAAAACGTIQIVSSVTQPDFETTAASTDAPKILQLYVHGDADWAEAMLARIKAAGYVALCLTVDTAVISARERVRFSRWTPPSRRYDGDRIHQTRMTWDSVERYRDMIGLPIIVKGIATAEDATIAVERGVDAVYVSNHGGRQLDHGQAAIDVLPEVVAAVNGRAAIVFDSGVQRGSDVVKALALGADAVAIGKLQAWAQAAAGEAGCRRTLEILQAKVRTTMALLGGVGSGQIHRSDQRLGLSGQPLVARQRPRTPFRRPTVFLNDPRTRHAHPLGPECPRQLPLPVPVPIPLPKRVLSTVSAAPEKLRKFLLKNGLDRGSDVLPQPVLKRIIAGVIGQ